MSLPLDRDRDGHSRNVVLLHERADRVIDDTVELALAGIVGGVGACADEQESGGENCKLRK